MTTLVLGCSDSYFSSRQTIGIETILGLFIIFYPAHNTHTWTSLALTGAAGAAVTLCTVTRFHLLLQQEHRRKFQSD